MVSIKNYADSLLKLKSKFSANLISFEGLNSPEEIYKNIDCLIHYPLDKEPFGRVIVEAYDAGVPLITTGLGGASEIFENKINGIKVIPYDHEGLFNAIENISKDSLLKEYFVKNSINKSKNIQKNIEKEIEILINNKEVA